LGDGSQEEGKEGQEDQEGDEEEISKIKIQVVLSGRLSGLPLAV
jgi:hypothetical protein